MKSYFSFLSTSKKKACGVRYSKTTLKTAYELPFAALFQNNRGQKIFEASDVIIVDDYVYAVSDNSWAISKFHKVLQPFSEQNVQVGDPGRVPGEDSGYEAILHDKGVFYVVRESVEHFNNASQSSTFHAVIEELSLSNDDYDIMTQCPSEFSFEGTSKGIEGVISLEDTNGDLIIFGLCEGNHCSEKYKFDIGNGRLVAMKKKQVAVSISIDTTVQDVDNDEGRTTGLATLEKERKKKKKKAENKDDFNDVIPQDSDCYWETLRVIPVPSSANFMDYSAIAINENGRVVISSQEESKVWIGQLKGLTEDGRVDSLDSLAFDESFGKVYSFPKSHECETIYCNIEGIHFINDEMLLAVSDKMKSRGKQDFRCFEKDQSIHAFVLP